MGKSKGSLNIYFCGSICGGRADQELYSRIIAHLKTYGTVLTEGIGRADLTDQDGVAVGREKWLHDRNMEWFHQADEEVMGPGREKANHDRSMEHFHKADVLVAEVTQPSLGVGYEMGRAVQFEKKTLCLFRPDSGRRLSCMLRGAADGKTFVVRDYAESDVCNVIDAYLREFVLDPEGDDAAQQ